MYPLISMLWAFKLTLLLNKYILRLREGFFLNMGKKKT